MAGMNTLADLFQDELRDVYDAEKRILKALPKMAKAASDEQLRDAFTTHLEETRGHVERLEQVFASLDEKPKGKRCLGMEGIIAEGAELMEEDGEESVLDAGLISAAQRVEHYEITAYGTLMAWAKQLGYDTAAHGHRAGPGAGCGVGVPCCVADPSHRVDISADIRYISVRGAARK